MTSLACSRTSPTLYIIVQILTDLCKTPSKKTQLPFTMYHSSCNFFRDRLARTEARLRNKIASAGLPQPSSIDDWVAENDDCETLPDTVLASITVYRDDVACLRNAQAHSRALTFSARTHLTNLADLLADPIGTLSRAPNDTMLYIYLAAIGYSNPEILNAARQRLKLL